MARVNLIPAQRQTARLVRRRVAGWKRCCIGYGGITVLACIAWLFGPGTSVGSTPAPSRDQSDAKVQEGRERVAQLQEELGRLERDLQAARIVGVQPDWGTFLRLIASRTGSNIVLSRCALATVTPANAGDDGPARPHFSVRIIGFGKAQSDVSDFLLRVERTGVMDSVMLLRSRREPFLAGSAIAFEVRCVIGAREAETR